MNNNNNNSNFFEQNARPERPKPSTEYGGLLFAISQRALPGHRNSTSVGRRPSWTLDEHRIFTNAVQYLTDHSVAVNPDTVLELIDSYFTNWDRNRRSMQAFIRSYEMLQQVRRTTTATTNPDREVARLDEHAANEELMLIALEINQFATNSGATITVDDEENIRVQQANNATEIEELRQAYSRAVERVEELEIIAMEHKKVLKEDFEKLQDDLYREVKERELDQRQYAIQEERSSLRNQRLHSDINRNIERIGFDHVRNHLLMYDSARNGGSSTTNSSSSSSSAFARNLLTNGNDETKSEPAKSESEDVPEETIDDEEGDSRKKQKK